MGLAFIRNQLKEELEIEMESIPLVGDIRGKGLLVGIELVYDIKRRKSQLITTKC